MSDDELSWKLTRAELARFGNQLINHHHGLDAVRERIAVLEQRLGEYDELFEKRRTNNFQRAMGEWYQEEGRDLLCVPRRVQRTKVVQLLPFNCKSVTRPTAWASPFEDEDKTPEEKVEMFRAHVLKHPALLKRARKALRGFDLACYCPLDQPCHADVWLRLVNA
jgi:Domain of unknown function (DUF4326)